MLVDAMSKTNLKDSLKLIHVCQGKVQESEVKEIFDRYEFKVAVKATHDSPNEL